MGWTDSKGDPTPALTALVVATNMKNDKWKVLKFGSTSFYVCDLTLLYWKVNLYLPLHFM